MVSQRIMPRMIDIDSLSLQHTFLYKVYTSHIEHEAAKHVLQEETHKISRARLEKDILKVIFQEENLSFDVKLACLSIILHSDAFDSFWEGLRYEADLPPEKCTRLCPNLRLVLSLPAMEETLWSDPLQEPDNMSITSSSNSNADAQESATSSECASSASTSSSHSEEPNRIHNNQLQVATTDENGSESTESYSDESMPDFRTEEEIELDKLLNPLSYYLPNPQPPSEALQKLFQEKMLERQPSTKPKHINVQGTVLRQDQDNPHVHRSGDHDIDMIVDDSSTKSDVTAKENICSPTARLPTNGAECQSIPPKKLVSILRKPSIDAACSAPKAQKHVRIDLPEAEMN